MSGLIGSRTLYTGEITTDTSVARPAFHALCNTNTTLSGGSSGYITNWNVTSINVGACWNATSGTFTAPADGHYVFFFDCVGRNNSARQSDIYLHKNGSYFSIGQCIRPDDTGLASKGSSTGFVLANAGDYFNWHAAYQLYSDSNNWVHVGGWKLS